MKTSDVFAKIFYDKEHNKTSKRSLYEHSKDVVEAFTVMFGTKGKPTHLAEKWLKFFKLDSSEFDKFHKNTITACWLHDIGKANSGFQNMLNRKGSQVVRHEHISGILLSLPSIREWFENEKIIDYSLLRSAVIGHHLKADFESFGEWQTPEGSQSFIIYTTAILKIFSELLPHYENKELPAITVEKMAFSKNETTILNRSIEKLKDENFLIKRKFSKEPSLLKMLIAIRSALIAADSAGSGITRESLSIGNWLSTIFSESHILAGNDITDKVIKPRIKEIEEKNKIKFTWSDWQIEADNFPSRSLLIAPCGSGKTLAAWRWIKKQIKKTPSSRVIFLYPTRATATEGFRDYVSWAPEADAALMHGTSVYELVDMFANTADGKSSNDYSVTERLYAIAYWQKRIFSATVDQFFGFIQHSYKSLCLLPVLVDSVLVIDEIHSFDINLFSALKAFLKKLDIPVLCMTASLTKSRQKDLEELGITIVPSNKHTFYDLNNVSEMSRYRVKILSDKDNALEIARKHRSKKRILWVVNTISKCQELAEEMNAICYHSAFTLDDRKERHDQVITAFKQSDKPAIAVTTQVCEMSLELDAEILITEEAPITSLIQRMGRCNRHSKPEDNKLGDVYIYRPERFLPYQDEEMEGVEEFTLNIDGKEVSQEILEQLLNEYGPEILETEKYTSFFQSGPWAVSREEKLRDISDYTLPAILDNQVESYAILKDNNKPTAGLFVPAPKYQVEFNNGIKQYVTKSENYNPLYGLLRKGGKS